MTDHWVVTVAQDQGYLGRCYVTLRKHRQHLHELSVEEWNDLASVINQLENAITVSLGATLFNWACMMNNAYQVETPVPHIHWHVRPRYSSPATFKGDTYLDNDFGHHYDRNHRNFVSQSTISEITAKINSAL